MRAIVLATDGSPSAANATLRAVELARTLGAAVVAVSVEHAAEIGTGHYGYADVMSELTNPQAERVEQTLAQAVAIAAEAGVECEPVHRRGRVPTEICRLAARRNARMIVIGAHGRGPIRRAPSN